MGLPQEEKDHDEGRVRRKWAGGVEVGVGNGELNVDEWLGGWDGNGT